MAEFRSIRLEPAAWRALKDHFSAKRRVYRLWDEFGHEPESQAVRDLIATWFQRGVQAAKVMERLLGRRVASGVRFWYDRKVFVRQYGKERREHLTPEQLMKHASPEIKEIWTQVVGIQKMVEDLKDTLGSVPPSVCDGAA